MNQAGSRRPEASQATGNASRALAALGRLRDPAGRVDLGVLVLGILAGLLAIATEFLTVVTITVGSTSCEAAADPTVADRCVSSGGEQHRYAFVLVGLVMLAMARGAGLGRSRPAAAALLALGIAVLAISIAIDLPATRQVGAVGQAFDQAEAHSGPGFWVELVGGALAVLAGTARLTRPEP